MFDRAGNGAGDRMIETGDKGKLQFFPGPMEGVMRPHFVRAANEMQLFSSWVTPFFRFSDALPRRKHLEAFYAPFAESAVPVTVQIMGTDPDILAAGAALFCELGAAGIDLNCGCPSRQVTSGGAGGGALRDPARMLRIAEAVKRAIAEVPFSIKLRTGWERSSEMEHILPMLADSGTLSCLTVHFRTVSEQYRAVGGREERWARALALTAGLPVILNGDLNTPEELREIPLRLGAAGGMSARGILRDPYLLRRAAGLNAPDAETGRLQFFAAALRHAAGGLSPGQAIELSNFMWGAKNPYFERLKWKKTPILPDFLQTTV